MRARRAIPKNRSAALVTRSAQLLLLSTMLSLTLPACRVANAYMLADGDYPGTLQHPGALPIQAVWQQHVTADWTGPDHRARSSGFDAAVQRRGDRLTVLGLSPMGSVGFSVEQGPDGIHIENNIPDQMVLPPRFILLDVQRTFYPWTDADAPNAPQRRTARLDGEDVQERWDDGKLIERSFSRTTGDPAGVIRIQYEWGRDDWAVPTRAVLDNGWFGYRLTIVTHSETRIPAEERP